MTSKYMTGFVNSTPFIAISLALSISAVSAFDRARKSPIITPYTVTSGSSVDKALNKTQILPRTLFTLKNE